MKTRHTIALLFVFGLFVDFAFGQTAFDETSARNLQKLFQEMIDKAEMDPWTDPKTCDPKEMVRQAKSQINLLPDINAKEPGLPDLLEAVYTLEEDFTTYEARKKGKQIIVANKEFESGNCSYFVQSYVRVVDSGGENYIWCKITTTVRMDCNCDENSDEKDIRKGAFYYEAFLLYNTERRFFAYPSDKSQIKEKLKIVRIECCPPKEEEKPKEDGEGFMTEDEDCCTTEWPKQTIGFLPGFALTDNFKNFSYDVALEYARDFGETFPGNRLYAGGLAGYMEVNSQEGEVKESMFYGAVFGENRTPISKCSDVQWINRLVATYGSGNIEGFGNTEDFTTWTFGLHTGANFQLTDSFSIGADVTVLNFGSIKYKSQNGMEFKEDLGDLYVNKGNRVRFGFRLKF